MVAGIALFLVRSGMTDALNRLYRGLPGRFQYPPWFITVFAAVVVVFGAAVAILSALFGRG
jgi:hypothetical protein